MTTDKIIKATGKVVATTYFRNGFQASSTGTAPGSDLLVSNRHTVRLTTYAPMNNEPMHGLIADTIYPLTVVEGPNGDNGPQAFIVWNVEDRQSVESVFGARNMLVSGVNTKSLLVPGDKVKLTSSASGMGLEISKGNPIAVSFTFDIKYPVVLPGEEVVCNMPDDYPIRYISLAPVEFYGVLTKEKFSLQFRYGSGQFSIKAPDGKHRSVNEMPRSIVDAGYQLDIWRYRANDYIYFPGHVWFERKTAGQPWKQIYAQPMHITQFVRLPQDFDAETLEAVHVETMPIRSRTSSQNTKHGVTCPDGQTRTVDAMPDWVTKKGYKVNVWRFMGAEYVGFPGDFWFTRSPGVDWRLITTVPMPVQDIEALNRVILEE